MTDTKSKHSLKDLTTDHVAWGGWVRAANGKIQRQKESKKNGNEESRCVAFSSDVFLYCIQVEMSNMCMGVEESLLEMKA